MFDRCAPYRLVLLATSLIAASCRISDPSAPTPGVPELAAVADGKSDATQTLRIIDSGAAHIPLPPGDYRLTRPLVVELDRVGRTSISGGDVARLVMYGPGPAIRIIGTHKGTADPGTVAEAVWERQRMPVIAGLEIVGAHDEAVGLEATGTMQLVIQRVTIRRALHGVHLTTRNRNVIIADSHFYENRGIGLFLDGVDLHQIGVTNCHISYNRGGGVVVRGGNVRNLQIGACDIEGNMGSDSPPTANVLIDTTGGGSIGEVAIAGCTIQHDHNAPGSANVRILGNGERRSFTEELRDGNVTIADNVMSDVQVNIDIRDRRGVTIAGNTLWKGYTHDLRVENGSGIVLAANVFDQNPRYHYGDGAEARRGLVFRDCDGVTITGIHVSGIGAAPAGLLLERCRRFNITGSTILDCPLGVRLEEGGGLPEPRLGLSHPGRPPEERGVSLARGDGRPGQRDRRQPAGQSRRDRARSGRSRGQPAGRALRDALRGSSSSRPLARCQLTPARPGG